MNSILIASFSSETVGIGGIEIHGEYGLLRSLVITNSFQGKGYGKALCKKLIQQAKNKGVNEVYLLTNTASGFFKKLGFEETNRSMAPTAMHNTTEFKELCPISSTCMKKNISGTGHASQHAKGETKTTCSCGAPSRSKSGSINSDEMDVRSEVRKTYAERAKSAEDGRCCEANTVIAQAGYSEEELKSLPESAKSVAAGCGNPTSLAELRQGETVLDLGSGGGIDVLLAAQEVGPTGKVIGVDMTPEMIDTARQNASKKGAKNVEFRLGEIEHLPVADESVDVIISNCVINLSPEKGQVFKEAYRALKKGGRILVSDMMVSGMPADMRKSISLWANCIGGAIELDEYLDAIKTAGFTQVEVVNKQEYSKDLISEALQSAVINAQHEDKKTALDKLTKLLGKHEDRSAIKVLHAEISAKKE
jgi:ubiquinone/menaquinone biosynthesis C-methylase UbiE/N-acetylglutamate synthase-like GNAT family acetyltransferase